MKPLLLYIHGFNSSPKSLKATIMAEYCRRERPDIRVEIPQMPCYPTDAAKFIDELVQSLRHDYQIGLVGSSLGGISQPGSMMAISCLRYWLILRLSLTSYCRITWVSRKTPIPGSAIS